MSWSLLSEPSMVKLFDRALRPLTENCPEVPTPGPKPGPTDVPVVAGDGKTPGASCAKKSNVLMPGNGNACNKSELKLARFDPSVRFNIVCLLGAAPGGGGACVAPTGVK